MAEFTIIHDGSGWQSFRSYLPDFMIGMSNKFYSFKGGNIFVHDQGEQNTFYGVKSDSTLSTVINSSVLENKLFKTISIQGTHPWRVEAYTDIQPNGIIESSWFERKENVLFAHIRNFGEVPAIPDEFMQRSMGGIGNTLNVTKVANVALLMFDINTPIDSSVSIGDYVYFIEAGLDPGPQLGGRITNLTKNYQTSLNRITIDVSITGASEIMTINPFILFLKNPTSESSGVLGHYCKIDMSVTPDSKIELLAIESEVMKSYP